MGPSTVTATGPASGENLWQSVSWEGGYVGVGNEGVIYHGSKGVGWSAVLNMIGLLMFLEEVLVCKIPFHISGGCS